MTIYKKVQLQNCRQTLSAAQAAYAEGDSDVAAPLPATIDASSDCAAEAKSQFVAIMKEPYPNSFYGVLNL